jgi:membrane protease YdiL (CAAX protease family)
MTAIHAGGSAVDRRDPTRGDRAAWLAGGGLIVVAGCVLLEARPLLVAGTAHAGAWLVLLFAALLVAGACWPLPRPAADRPLASAGTARGRWLAVVAIGFGAFAVGRWIGGGHAPGPFTPGFVAATMLAALAEEALFRRLCYGLLAPVGAGWAMVGSAMLFALVHVTTYGFWVLPLDLAAGLVLGWQRSATGRWSAPAVTHVLANLLVLW